MLARHARFALVVCAGLSFQASASAQLEPVEPAPPPAYEPAPAAPAQPAPPVPDAPSQPTYMAEGEAAATSPAFESTANWGEPSDHQRVVGSPAVGFLGVIGVPVHDGEPDSDAIVDAPTLGIRYWFNEDVGIDAGLGLGLDSTGGTSATDSSESDLPGTSLFGFALHVGLPISAWDTAHYNAVLIPELNFGFATGENEGTDPGTDDDLSLTGLLFQVGFRAGAEFHLEVLDVPQATLQITIGLGFAVELRDMEDNAGNSESLSNLHLQTNLVSLGSALRSGIQVFFYL